MEQQEHQQPHDKAAGPVGGSANTDAGKEESRRYDAPVEAKRGADGKLDVVPERDAIMGRDREEIGRATDDYVESPSYGDEGGGELFGEEDGRES